jgi:hypothetical protein
MRQFVIVVPGLTLGPPGTYLNADEMHMDDDQLDAFVEARYATEIHTDNNHWTAGRVTAPDDTPLDDLPGVDPVLDERVELNPANPDDGPSPSARVSMFKRDG